MAEAFVWDSSGDNMVLFMTIRSNRKSTNTFYDDVPEDGVDL